MSKSNSLMYAVAGLLLIVVSFCGYAGVRYLPGLIRMAALAPAKNLDPRGDAFWKHFYLQNTAYRSDALVAMQHHAVHPTRGWTPLPNDRGGEPPETTNNRGQRSTADYVFRDEAFRVMVLGDSFTFGAEASDDAVWPTILQSLNTHLAVINLAVGAYGIDQMYLALREEIAEYKPHLVLFAPITDDFTRSMLSFRDYAKPRFVLGADGALELTHVPTLSVEETVKSLRDQYGLFTAGFSLRRENEAFLQTVADGAFEKARLTLNERILSEAATCARVHGSEMLFVHLASGEEIKPGFNGTPPLPDLALLMAVAERSGSGFLSTGEAFRAAGHPWGVGHYKKPEAELVAKVVHGKIQAMPAYQHFLARNDASAR